MGRLAIYDVYRQVECNLTSFSPSYDAGEALDVIIQDALGAEESTDGSSSGQGILGNVFGTVSSLRRFARSLTR